jgi:hypothetical protein
MTCVGPVNLTPRLSSTVRAAATSATPKLITAAPVPDNDEPSLSPISSPGTLGHLELEHVAIERDGLVEIRHADLHHDGLSVRQAR